MKIKRIKHALFLFFGIICFILILNVKVITRQGVNYKVQLIKIPLYLKILDFFDRHYNYVEIIKRITTGSTSEEEKVIRIFEWTNKNIRKIPEGFPIIDDHVWHIIIRGYGAGDQSQDVFTTLCNYAGTDAFYSYVYTKDRTKRIMLSFVKIRGKWYVFDPRRGVYFKDTQGDRLVDIETIRYKNSWVMKSNGKEPEMDYAIYFNNLPLIKDLGLGRSNIQSPFKRLKYEIKRWLKL